MQRMRRNLLLFMGDGELEKHFSCVNFFQTRSEIESFTSWSPLIQMLRSVLRAILDDGVDNVVGECLLFDAVFGD